MSKRVTLFLAVAIGASVAYDFYRGYHETRSTLAGIVAVVFGLVVLAFFLWLYRRPNSN
jgi:cytochrome c biogenesis protein CcdA